MAEVTGRRLGPGVSVPLNPLIGRETMIREIETLLTNPDVRLVTLTGPGGVGKSHLAMQVAVDSPPEFPDGSAFISLASVRDADLLIPAIAETLGVSEGDQSLVERLEAWLADRQMLLVFDNFEQILSTAPLIARLLGRCPRVTALVTSRVMLRLSGEHALEVPPLSIPNEQANLNAGTLRDNSAVRLFIDRARAAGASIPESADHLAAVASVCRRLDGLPLAIELAAALTPILNPRQLLGRSRQALPLLKDGPRDAPQRQRTMRDAIAWSYDLLEPSHQALFRRLSVFSGGFSFDAAQLIARGWQPEHGYPFAGGRDPLGLSQTLPMGKEDPESTGSWEPLPLPPLAIDPIQGVWTLVSQHLVRLVSKPADEPRFEMFETIREFGLEQLAAAGESWAVRHAFAAWVLAEAEEAGLGLWGPERRRWAAVIAADIGNVRSALGWLLMQDDPANQMSLRIAEGLWAYWHMYGHATEGRTWLERALARPSGTPLARARAQVVLAMLSWMQGDDQRASDVLADAVPVMRAHGDESALARGLFCQSLVAWRREDLPRMISLAREALPHFEAVDDHTGGGVCMAVLALVARATGDYQTATTLLQNAETEFNVADFRWGIATARYYAGEVAREHGDAERGERLIEQALVLYQEWGDPWGIGTCVVALGSIASSKHDLERAARLFGGGFALCESVGAFLPPTELARYREIAKEVRTTLGASTYDLQSATGRKLSMDGLVSIALGQPLVEVTRVEDVVDSPENDDDVRAQFTRRQLEVISLLAAGHPVKEIAFQWNCGKSNVYSHIRKACARAGVSTDAELVAYAIRRGIVK